MNRRGFLGAAAVFLATPVRSVLKALGKPKLPCIDTVDIYQANFGVPLVGRHYDVVIMDDLISLESPADTRVLEYWRQMPELAKELESKIIWGSTPYLEDDLVAKRITQFAEIYNTGGDYPADEEDDDDYDFEADMADHGLRYWRVGGRTLELRDDGRPAGGGGRNPQGVGVLEDGRHEPGPGLHDRRAAGMDRRRWWRRLAGVR